MKRYVVNNAIVNRYFIHANSHKIPVHLQWSGHALARLAERNLKRLDRIDISANNIINVEYQKEHNTYVIRAYMELQKEGDATEPKSKSHENYYILVIALNWMEGGSDDVPIFNGTVITVYQNNKAELLVKQWKEGKRKSNGTDIRRR